MVIGVIVADATCQMIAAVVLWLAKWRETALGSPAADRIAGR